MSHWTYIETADSFYRQLEAACADELTVNERYEYLRSVFRHAVEQAIADSKIAFVGFFSKVDYCIKEHAVPHTVASLIQMARKEIFPKYSQSQELDVEAMSLSFAHNLKATALLVYHLCGKAEIPAELKAHFPYADRSSRWGKFDENVLRVIVERWDEHHIWATEEQNNSTIQICYDETNTVLTREGKGDWSYLNKILWTGAQLNLVRVRTNHPNGIAAITERGSEGKVYPELIILEPDYLINITTVASCFEAYAESPFVNLINKIKPAANTMPIHLGNLSGQFLDDTVHGRDISFDDSLKEYVNKNALSMITCSELIQNYTRFKDDAACQRRNIQKLIGQDLPKSIDGYDRSDVVLEPSFFSEVLGIQGRLDFLFTHGNDVCIIEQKSGKGDFVPYSAAGYNPNIPVPKEQHEVQLLLYRALFIYEFKRYASELKHIMLLYSKYNEGLLNMAPNPELFLRAIRMRNLLAWSEMQYASDGFGLLTTLTPNMMNQKGVTGKYWEMYVKPELERLLLPVRQASDLERMYYLRFMKFLAQELLLSKVGNKQKENSGFASIWSDTLEEKKAAGNIYDQLTIRSFVSQGDTIEGIVLNFADSQSADTSNFRTGDIVILYPYGYEEARPTPYACAQMVHRATIVEINADSIELRLRNSQTDKKNFMYGKGTEELKNSRTQELINSKTQELKNSRTPELKWAIEHDMFESSAGSLYSALHSFLSAPQERRDLLLSQRQPKVDTEVMRKGEYGAFDTLVEHAKQARDLFLIIGPPGTGKTSFGLVNLLKEELLDEDSNILLLSYTNRAVDEICSKLVEFVELNNSTTQQLNNSTTQQLKHSTYDFIRIGSELSCAKEYRDYLLSSRTAKLSGGNDTQRLIKQTRIFCGTASALNANMSLLELKHFSLAIIDESSQILEPHLIGLLSAHKDGVCRIDRFVMIGDHKQLPAVVQQSQEESMVTDEELRAINLTDCRLSLFERLLAQFKINDTVAERGDSSTYDPRFVYMLTKQGRMHRDISDFPSRAFYDGKLSIVPLEHQEQPVTCVESDNAIVTLLTSHRLSFVSVVPNHLAPSSKTNLAEARVIAEIVGQIYNIEKEGFTSEHTIGIIVPYRNQISTVRSEIDKLGVPLLHDITIDTVERYQGSQRDYIIYGFTVQQHYQLNFLASNTFEEDGAIIDRKLNVAMTRARLNLIMVGNPHILGDNPVFHELIDYTKLGGGYMDAATPPCARK